MPATHKFYRHLSKNASSFNLWFPHRGSSSGSSYWRKLFLRSSSSDVAGPRKRSTSTDSGSPAPHIQTLNMTRASFTLDESHTPIVMPMRASTPPTAAAIPQQSKISITPRREEGRSEAPGSKLSGIGLDTMNNSDTIVDEDTAESEKVEDVERGLNPIPTRINSWQQGVDADADADRDVNRTDQDKNETTRAQYEFGSRR